MAVHLLGIRHHGVGSAKHVLAALEEIKPDCLLIEGPPEISEILKNVGDSQLKPPVAIMVYDSNNPKESTFYPFAEYSPEWVAAKWGNDHGIPIKALDLPAAKNFLKRRNKMADKSSEVSNELTEEPYKDPLSILAEAAGYETGEAWWDDHFEHSHGDSIEHFESVRQVMTALREEGLKSGLDQENIDREAYMRLVLTECINEMYGNIVVVCGAWHVPALVDLSVQYKNDQRILKKLPKQKVAVVTTWIPWTNGRLSMFSGYGAGIYSPGWYAHLWNQQDDGEIQWLSKVAETFRESKMDTSTAHVIETFKLARSLSIIREKHYVSLTEMNDAIKAVMCMGDDIMLQLINEKLIIGEEMGEVPDDIPKMPLQEDFEQVIKKLRLKLSAAPKQHDLDLRKEIDRSRSILFHRLEILEIPWLDRATSTNKGTFKESWTSQWAPEMMIAIIDKAFLGNTIESAAQAILIEKAKKSDKINELAGLIKQSIPAELFEELAVLLDKINELSSISSDIIDLIKAIPRLIEVTRYGDVRKSDLSVLNVIVEQLLIKVFTGLPNACYGLDEDNSQEMFEGISELHQSMRIYGNETLELAWFETLNRVMSKEGVNPIIAGCTCRLLLDAQQFDEEESDRLISYALSSNHEPTFVASWLEGFLKGSGMILIYDHRLWNLIYGWVSSLSQDIFMELLPLLRRSFAKFEFGERRQIGEKAKKGLVDQQPVLISADENFDFEKAASILPIIAKFLQVN